MTQGHRGGADRGPPVICASWDAPVPGLPPSLRAWAACPLTTSPAPGAALAFCIHRSRSRKQNPPREEENYQVKQCFSSSWGLTEIQIQASPPLETLPRGSTSPAPHVPEDRPWGGALGLKPLLLATCALDALLLLVFPLRVPEAAHLTATSLATIPGEYNSPPPPLSSSLRALLAHRLALALGLGAEEL